MLGDVGSARGWCVVCSSVVHGLHLCGGYVHNLQRSAQERDISITHLLWCAETAFSYGMKTCSANPLICRSDDLES